MTNVHVALAIVMLAGALRLSVVSFADVDAAMTSKHLCTLGRVRDAGFGVAWFVIALVLVWAAVWPFWPFAAVTTAVATIAYAVAAIRRTKHWRHEQAIIARAKRMRRAASQTHSRKPEQS